MYVLFHESKRLAQVRELFCACLEFLLEFYPNKKPLDFLGHVVVNFWSTTAILIYTVTGRDVLHQLVDVMEIPETAPARNKPTAPSLSTLSDGS